MQLSYNWLKTLVDLEGISPELLADKLTSGGLEVEGMSYQAKGSNLVIGLVKSCEKHPNSDHLHLCQVDIGGQTLQIVCGAPNVDINQKVIVALPGCILTGKTIEAGTIRGEKSNGMLCSLAELGVDPKQLTPEQLAGIEILPADAKIGEREVLKYLNLDDVLLEVSLTPNRADCLAMWAMAKEVGAILNRKVNLPQLPHEDSTEKQSNLKIELETEKCNLYLGKVINKIVIKESPDWIKKILQSNGINSINNVVDISNLVMLETGQPVHYYDLKKIKDQRISVKQDLDLTYEALDEVKYPIQKEDIMIMNEDKPVGIAGIMGGEDSKIDETTKGIIIEAANFDHVSIRKTARRLNLNTEAATRFSKIIEPLAPEKAVKRSVMLLKEYAQAQEIETTVIAGKPDYEVRKINLSVAKVNEVLGTKLSIEEIIDPLKRLDLNPEVDSQNISVTVPSYRYNDLVLAEDIIEEIIRIVGYDKIVSTLPLMPQTIGSLEPEEKMARTIKTVLNGMGLTEIITYSLVSEKENKEGVMPIGEPLEIKNPLSDERRYYRTSLMPSMLETLAYNHAHSQPNCGLFEISEVYDAQGNSQTRLSLAISNQLVQSDWQKLRISADFYILKGIILAFLEELGFGEKRVSFKENKTDIETFHPAQSAEIYLDKQLIGIFGRLHPLKNQEYDIDRSVVGELFLSKVFESTPTRVHFTPIPRFPGISYDLALLVDSAIPAQSITDLIKKEAGSLLNEVKIFDVYQGSNILSGKKSIAVRLDFLNTEKTLNDADVKPIVQKVIDSLHQNLKAEIRNG